MKKSIVLTILFVLCISLFFVIIVSTPDKEYSQSERRLLAQFPKVDNIVESGMFLQDFEKYSADQFPFLLYQTFVSSVRPSLRQTESS